MTNVFPEWLLPWLLTYWVHSTLLLGALFAAARLGWVHRRASTEFLWKFALVGGMITASLQLSVVGAPLSGRYEIAHPATAGTSRHITSPATTSIPTAPKPAARRHVAAEQASAKPLSADVSASTATRAQTTASPIAIHWRDLVLAVWLACVLLLTVRLTRAGMTTRRELRGRLPLEDKALQARIAQTAQRAGLRRAPRVSVLPSLSSPISLPNGEICLPEWTLAQLDSAQMQALLAHEIAHCARRDPQWLLAGIAIRTLFFFQPLNALAQRRVATLAELACDDWAAETTGEGRALAECLAHCVEHMTRSRALPFASAMARKRSTLLERAERLAHGIREPGGLSPALRLLVLGILPVLAFIAPGVGLSTSLAAPAASKHSHARSNINVDVNESDENGHHSLIAILSNGAHQIELQMHGKVSFNKDENGIARMSPGATLDISEKGNGARYRAYFRANGGNKINRRFYVNGTKKLFNAKAKHWLAHIIPALLRNSGINASKRVQRILAKRGPSGVLDEIDKIDSGYARSLYIRDLVAGGKLASAMIGKTIEQAKRIGSGYELGQTLKAIVTSQSLNNAQTIDVLNAAKNIEGDYQAGQVLQTIAAKLTAPKPSIVRAYLNAVDSIHSDYARSQALLALIEKTRLNRQMLGAALDSVRGIDSDYQRLQVLKALAKQMPNDSRLIDKYRELARSLGDYMRGEAKRALSRRLRSYVGT